MFVIDVRGYPAVITDSVPLMDTSGVLAGALEGLPTELAVNTSATTIVNDDGSVNLDLEGISKSIDGGFWVFRTRRRAVLLYGKCQNRP